MLTKRSFICCTLALLACVLAISCSNQTPSSDISKTTGGFKSAIILSGSHEDGSWSQGGYEGLKLIEQKYNAQVAYAENVLDTDSAALMRQYAQEGYNLIIGHSGGYIDAAETVAKEFPRTKFAVVSTYAGNNKNLGAVAFRSGEVGYLSGVVAAMKSQTQKVGYIVGADYPVYQEEATLFERGAKAKNPAMQVSIEFLQSWTDTKKATKVAMGMVDAGVDVIAMNADEAGIAAIREVVKRPNVRIIGWTKDQHAIAPDRIITSVLQDIPQLVLKAASLAQEGRWEGKLYKFGLKDKIYDFAPFRGALSPAEEADFNTIRQKVIEGSIDVAP